MKIVKIFKALAAVCLLGIGANALEEGVNYQVLQKPLNVPKNSVVKIFNYDCPHCYTFDRTVTPQLMKKLEGTEFLPWHLKTKGVFGQTASGVFAALIVLDEKDDVSLLSDESKFKKAKFAIYKAVHDKKDDFDEGSDKQRFIKTALDTAGVSMSEYEAALASKKAQALLAQWDAGYDVAVISGVPAFVVSGKYLLNTSSFGSLDEMVAAVKELLAK
ncbi:thiol:disulfide interchange protein DsbA/DsbL [uncultured Campylobacter sp.]|uniref:thiol:disulfide interchange protein DsbA/DsbL n=1 Tax=uncultured Campylobacter sp. TaxID=218934 RepID=UPI00260B3BE8|nr:thiol:disulfide interchange protein DsbA/DsbL [uncultured Campylobacter sp.]